MIKANVALTIISSAVLAALVWKFRPVAWDALHLTGLVLLVIGFAMWTVARFQLGRSLTVTAQARQLVDRGLYSRIRNPIYVLGSVTIAGFILVVARPIWLLTFGIIVPLQTWRAHEEAKVLEANFGEQYRAYRQKTWF